MTSVALFGFLGAGNLGNDASLEVVLEWLSRNAPAVQITLITSDPNAARDRFGYTALPMTLYPPLGPPGLAHKARRGLGRAADLPRFLQLAGRFDAVIVPGMGVFEESLPVGPWGFPLTMAMLASACRVRGRPFVLLAVGAEQPVDRSLERLFRLTARAASHVSCRDPLSADGIEAWTAVRPRVYPDLAFAHHVIHRPAVPDDHEGTVVIGVIGGDWEAAYQGTRRVHTDYLGALRDVSTALLDRDHRVVLTGGDQVDLPVMAALRHAVLAERPKLAERVVTAHVTTYEELASQLATARLVVASRYHNLVCALSCARPTISVSYAQKCTDLMRSVGMGGQAHDIRDVISTDLVDDALRALDDSRGIIAQLQAGSAGRAAAVNALLDDALGGCLA